MPRIPTVLVFLMLSSVLPAAVVATPGVPCETIWARQFGTSGYEDTLAMALDANDQIYLTGITRGNIGAPPAGFDDAFLVKFDAAGQVLWSRQLGTDNYDYAAGVGFDGRGDVYIAGSTLGDLDGKNAGFIDGFIAKYASNGDLLWIHQFGTAADERVLCMGADELGCTYVAGSTEGAIFGPPVGQSDVFIVKFDADGEQVWARHIGTTAFEQPRSLVVARDGCVFVAGQTNGGLGGTHAGLADAFLIKLNPDGETAWARQFGSSANDVGMDVALDGDGNVFVTGHTEGSLAAPNVGNDDAFLAKFSADGTALWIRQAGSPWGEQSNAVAADSAGNAYILGTAWGNFAAVPAGNADMIIAKYDSAGTLRWTRQAGTAVNEYGNDIAIDARGDLVIYGESTGAFAGTYLGSFDPVLLKLRPSCPADADCDGGTDVADLLIVINGWGSCTPPCLPHCAADINRDCTVNVADLLAVIAGWGPCM